MDEITEYQLILDKNVRDFNSQVNEALSAGWILYGYPLALPGDDDAGSYLGQALVKNNEAYGNPNESYRKKS